MGKLKMVELFGGYGAQSQGIKEANIDCESVGISEWNVYSLIAYDAVHTDDGVDYSEGKSKKELIEELSKFTFSTDGHSPCDIKKLKEDLLRKLYSANKRSKNLGSIIDLKVEDIPDCDLITYSYPCQAISIAGKQEGLTRDSGTASSLLWECDRIIKAKKPKYLLMENVKNLISKKFKPEFDSWCKLLEDYGYKNYYQVLNAKDYELPQNRERVFMISVRNDIEKPFIFPSKIDLKFRLKDFLDDDVADNYYLSE